MGLKVERQRKSAVCQSFVAEVSGDNCALLVLFSESAGVLGLYFASVFCPFPMRVSEVVSELFHAKQTSSPKWAKRKFNMCYENPVGNVLLGIFVCF